MASITVEENIINYSGLKLPAILETAPTEPEQAAILVKKGTADNEVIESAGDNEICLGFLNEGANPASPTAGEGPALAAEDRVTVYKPGNVVWARCSGSVTVGAELMSAAAGEVKDRGVTAGTVYNVVAIALSAGADHDHIPVEVVRYTVNTAVS